LVRNLVATVQGAAIQERTALAEVIEARAKATSVNVDPSTLTDPAKFQQFQQAQDGLSSALGRLMVVVERYPDLKSNQNFLALQTSLESIADEVRFEQRKFNETAQLYNNYIQTVPNNMIANFGGFDEKGYFKAAEGAEVAPTVDFSN